MSKNKHHYVPRFYLKNFASQPRRIHIFHIEKQLAIRSGSLRDQCYKHKLYGRTDDVEDSLSPMEGDIASVIRAIFTASRSFHLNTDEHKWILIFLALQITRTAAMAEKVNEGVDKLTKVLFSREAELEGIDLSLVKVGYENPVLHSMQHFPKIAAHLSDLVPHLLINKTTNHFITSDNPIVLYNKYCEGIKGIGTTGAASRGLQIFVPLSPTHALLFYDSKIYKVSDRDNHISILTSVEDVKMLNLLCAVNADDVLLFADWREENAVRQLARKAKKYRRNEGPIVEEFVSDDDPYRSLIHFSFESLNVGLDLSFINLRRRVQRVPLTVRMQEYRNQPTPAGREQGNTLYRRRNPDE